MSRTPFCVSRPAPLGRDVRVSKKWLNATFSAFTGFASRIRSRAAKPAKYENLWVFIRSDAHVVRAGWNIRGCGPLSTPWFFDNLPSRPLGRDVAFADKRPAVPENTVWLWRRCAGALTHPRQRASSARSADRAADACSPENILKNAEFCRPPAAFSDVAPKAVHPPFGAAPAEDYSLCL